MVIPDKDLKDKLRTGSIEKIMVEVEALLFLGHRIFTTNLQEDKKHGDPSLGFYNGITAQENGSNPELETRKVNEFH